MGLLILEPSCLASTTDAPGTAYLEEATDFVHDSFSKHAPGNPELGQLRLYGFNQLDLSC